MDFKQIQSIIRDFEKSNITTLDIETEGFKLRLRKNAEVVQTQVLEQPKVVVVQETSEIKNEIKNEIKTEEDKKYIEVKAPLVGTYYSANSPEEKPFVSVGQKVQKGQTLCIIEAMKIMNEITSPADGILKQINLSDGEAVGYEQTIMVIA